MFNLITIHYGKNTGSKYYGIEIGTFYGKEDGYGLFVFLYDLDRGTPVHDLFYMSAVLQFINNILKNGNR